MIQQQIQKQLKKYDITPNKILGQNFLIDEHAVEELVDAANISKKDVVVEVGPGTGVITKELAKRAKRVIAVEKDARLIPILKKELMSFKNVSIVNDDILNFNPKNYSLSASRRQANAASRGGLTTHYSLIGAPPYYLTSRLFRHFLENTQVQPVYIAVIIQKEVAKKIVSKPPRSNLLAVSVQFYGKPHIIKTISKSAFWPRPKVDSAILVVEDIHKPKINEEKFFKIVRAGFSSPRKQLATNLIQKLKLPRTKIEQLLKSLNIDPSRRAQTLTVGEWVQITKLL